MIGTLERVGSEVENLGQSQWYKGFLPYIKPFRPLLREHDLPFVVAQVQQVACVGKVEEFPSRPLD